MKTSIFTLIFSLLVISGFSRPLFTVEGNTVIIDIELIGSKARIVKVEMLTASAVRIISSNKTPLSNKPSLIVKEGLLPVKYKASYKDNNVEITTSDIIVNIEENGLVRIFNRESSRMVVCSDKSYQPSELEEGALFVKQRLFLNNNEQLFGLGQSESDRSFNIRGKRIDMIQSPVATASPVFFSDKGYAIIWDNYSKSSFIDTKGYLELNASIADEIQYIFIHGPGWDKIISEIRTITGKAPLFPRWAYGFWHASSSLGDKNTLAAITEKYHQEGIPADQYIDSSYAFFEKEKALMDQPADLRLVNALALQNLKTNQPALVASASRVCIPTRSAFPGIQQFGTYTITGAVPACWSSLKNQVITGLNLTLAGQPYWSTNIGGVASDQCSKEPYSELLTRWYQFAAFNPVFQISEQGREPWSIAKPGDPYFQAIRDAIRLRYRLLPYIYSVAHQVYSDNSSIVRPLYFEFPNDPKTLKIEQQFMFGPSIMVCPITDPGVQTTKVYFPGVEFDWIDFWTGKRYPAGSEATINVTLASIPLFVKGGSVIPLGGVYQSANDSLSTPLELRAYPGPKNEFLYFEDQNDGLSYQSGQVVKMSMIYYEKDKALDISGHEGTYPDFVVGRTFKAVLVSEGMGTGIDPYEKCIDIDYKGKRIRTKLE